MDIIIVLEVMLGGVLAGIAVVGSYGIGKLISSQNQKRKERADAQKAEEATQPLDRQFRDVHFKKVMIIITKLFGGMRVPVHIATVSTANYFYYWGKDKDRGAYAILTENVTLILKLPILLYDVVGTVPLKVSIKDGGHEIKEAHQPLTIGSEFQFSPIVDQYIEAEIVKQTAKAANEPMISPETKALKYMIIGLAVGAAMAFFMGWFFGSVYPITDILQGNSTKQVAILGGIPI